MRRIPLQRGRLKNKLHKASVSHGNVGNTVFEGLKSCEDFHSSPEGDSVVSLHLFPPLKRRAITRRPAARDWIVGSPVYSALQGRTGFPRRRIFTSLP